MNLFYQFLRLIRFGNLLIMGITMFVVRLFILKTLSRELSFIDIFTDSYFNFVVLSVILVGAAGNIINDYFDVRADRINKPNRLIIDVYIKRRWAIIFNWVFNGVSLIVIAGVSYELKSITLLGFVCLAIFILWIYSTTLKKMPLIGNLSIAFLTSIVPIYSLLYHLSVFPGINKSYTLIVILGFSGSAFLLNLSREIIKDLADLEGDKLLHARTLPILKGKKFSKVVTLSIGLFLIAFLIYVVNVLKYQVINSSSELLLINNSLAAIILLTAFGVLVLSAYIVLLNSNNSKGFKLSSDLMKYSMLFGLFLIAVL